LIDRTNLRERCPNDDKDYCYSKDKKDVMIRIGDLGEFPVRRCSLCNTGFYGGPDFWRPFEKFVDSYEKCGKAVCCCTCRFVWAEVYFETMTVDYHQCLRRGHKLEHGRPCEEFETLGMLRDKQMERWRKRRLNDRLAKKGIVPPEALEEQRRKCRSETNTET
jgi:hypothetical protein